MANKTIVDGNRRYTYHFFNVGDEIQFRDIFTRGWRTGEIKEILSHTVKHGASWMPPEQKEHIEQQMWLVSVDGVEFVVRQSPGSPSQVFEGEKRV